MIRAWLGAHLRQAKFCLRVVRYFFLENLPCFAPNERLAGLKTSDINLMGRETKIKKKTCTNKQYGGGLSSRTNNRVNTCVIIIHLLCINKLEKAISDNQERNAHTSIVNIYVLIKLCSRPDNDNVLVLNTVRSSWYHIKRFYQ